MADKEIKFNIEAIADEALKKVQQLQQAKQELKQDVSFDVEANTSNANKNLQELQDGMKALQKTVKQFKGIDMNTASYKELKKMTDAFADVFGNFTFDENLMRKSQKQYYTVADNIWSEALQRARQIERTNRNAAEQFLSSQDLDKSIFSGTTWIKIREGTLTAEQALEQLREKLGAVNNEVSKIPDSGSGIDNIAEDATSATKSLDELEKKYKNLSARKGTGKSSLYDYRTQSSNLLGELAQFDQSDERVKSLTTSLKTYQEQINSQIKSLSKSTKTSQQTKEIKEMGQAADSAAKSVENLNKATQKATGGSGKKSSEIDSEKAITAAYSQRVKLMERIQKAQIKLNTATTTQSRITASNNLENLKNAEEALVNLQKQKSILNADGQEITLFDAVDVKYGNQLLEVTQRLDQEMQSIVQKANAIKNSADYQKIQKSKDTGYYDKELLNITSRINQYDNASLLSPDRYNDLLMQQREMLELSQSLKNSEADLDGSGIGVDAEELIAQQKRFEELAKQSKVTFSQMQNDIKQYVSDEDALARSNKLEQLFSRNSKAASKYGKDMKAAIEQVRRARTEDEAKAGESEFNRLLQLAESEGLSGHSRLDTLSGMAKKFTSWYGVAQFSMGAVDALRQMYQAVVDVDSAMVELRKVSDATSQEIDAYFSTAADNAKELGVSVSDMINSTADFSRLGYGLEESEELARVATLYKNVGENMDIDTASSNIISTMQAFGIEADNAIGIVDSLNEVANRYGVDTSGLGESLKRSASSLEAANNTLDESIAMITAADEIIQNPESTGSALKTISMRIRGQQRAQQIEIFVPLTHYKLAA